jgi:hypothetical protein
MKELNRGKSRGSASNVAAAISIRADLSLS